MGECLFMLVVDLVDFRVVCFCYRNVVDMGFVCSICLSIFCELLFGDECLICGNKLVVGDYGMIKILDGLNVELVNVRLVFFLSVKRKRKLEVNGE